MPNSRLSRAVCNTFSTEIEMFIAFVCLQMFSICSLDFQDNQNVTRDQRIENIIDFRK